MNLVHHTSPLLRVVQLNNVLEGGAQLVSGGGRGGGEGERREREGKRKGALHLADNPQSFAPVTLTLNHSDSL